MITRTIVRSRWPAANSFGASSTLRKAEDDFKKVTQLAFNSNVMNFRIAKFRHSNLGPKFAFKMGPKYALTDIF